MASTRSKPEVSVQRNPIAGWLADRGVNVKVFITVLVMTCVALGTTVLSVARMAALNDDLATMKAAHVDSLQQLSNL